MGKWKPRKTLSHGRSDQYYNSGRIIWSQRKDVVEGKLLRGGKIWVVVLGTRVKTVGSRSERLGVWKNDSNN